MNNSAHLIAEGQVKQRGQVTQEGQGVHSFAEEQGALLIIEPIAPLAELECDADPRDLLCVEGFTSASRRAERLAWRKVLRSISPDAEVGYEPSGAPLLKNSQFTHISVSHSRTSVAVALSRSRCGVDIESLERNFERVAQRYITPSERALCAEPWWLAAVWCAKECAYKMMGREGVDFLRDITLCAVDTEACTISCSTSDGEEYSLCYALRDGREVVVYCL